MSRKIYILTAPALKGLGMGKHNDGGGLYFYNLPTGPQWVFRYTFEGKRREMGVGGYPTTTLADARKIADARRSIVKTGIDPIAEKQSALAATKAAIAKREAGRTLNDIAPMAFEARKSQLRGDGNAGRWYSPLKVHILPKLGTRQMDSITGVDIADTLRPIWHKQTSVATKAITRLGICLAFARAKGLDIDRNAIADAKELLGKQVHTPINIPAIDWCDVPAFYETLDGGGVVSLALRFLILTGVRSKPVRFIHVDQIEGDVWTIPAESVKGRKGKTKPFTVPLSGESLRIIEIAKPHARDGFLFAGERKGVISDASMARLMERRGLEARPHGFRSSLKTWILENTKASFEMADAVIGHSIGRAVSTAYIRSNFLDERRALTDGWCRHVTRAESRVVSMASKRRGGGAGS